MNRKGYIKERTNSRKYTTTKTGVLPCRWNVILISTANSWEHECEKCRICYLIRKAKETFITEAFIGSDKIDIINLTTGEEIEIVKTHGFDKAKAKGRTIIKI